MRIRAGTCAFADHESFYPKSLPPQERLRYYARYFSVVEIDSTFYGFLKEGTWQRWLDMVDESFLFHVKAHGAMTMHVRGLSRDERHRMASTFLDSLRPVCERGQLAAVLLQFPPWFDATRRNRAIVERLVEFCRDIPVAVEFRERSWFDGPERQSKTLSWLRSMRATHVVCDEPNKGNGCVPLVPAVTNEALGILRMHGRNAETWDKPGLKSSKERFDYRYSKHEILDLLPTVTKLASDAAEFHVLMNNNSNNDAVWNAFDWAELLGVSRLARPNLVHSTQLSLLGELDDSNIASRRSP
ncbi:DUF72 domain-containing protein [Alicyclobacillus acidiphilus]|uniref:DUF72 domain-containing protein n=1 Tax=Alicyclobacillus acidiphilus TaxID=182455 RepID=UPI00082C4AFA|nr:DUF72 domain-containing protein [Alicyclobacillus acidiphilus]